MTAELAETYDRFGRQWATGTSPIYEDWALTVAGDATLLDLISALPPAKRQPNIVFASARWEGAPLVEGDAWRDWMVAHWSAVAGTALARRVQTNEPNRCATLLPVLDALGGPLALLEVGASAGLCLLPDRYAYLYETPAGPRYLSGPYHRSDPLLTCRISNPRDAPRRRPEVVWRRGIDLDPVDIRYPEALRWLETLVWPGPDHDARVLRLRDAAAVAASAPPTVVRGDLVELLADVAAESPADATLVVFHSAVLMYLDPVARARFRENVSTLGARTRRKVVWISQETSSVIPADLPSGLDTAGRFVQMIDGMPLALVGQHGATYDALPLRTS